MEGSSHGRSSARTYVPYSVGALFQALLLVGVLAVGLVMAFTSLRIPSFHPTLVLVGIPDPLCGMTTGTLALMRGELETAIRANPLVLLFVPLTGTLAVERFYRLFSNRRGRQWTRLERRLALWGLIVLLTASWIYQLFRYGVL